MSTAENGTDTLTYAELRRIAGTGLNAMARERDEATARAERAEDAIRKALAATDSIGDQIIWDSAEAYDIPSVARRGLTNDQH